MIRRLLWPALVVALAAAAPPSQSHDAGWRRVADLYRQRVRDAGIVGTALMFVRGPEVVYSAFEGYQVAHNSRRVDESTIFHWASITKTLTGVAIMQLRDRGLLTLDDPAVKYVPELRQVHNPYGDISQVTIRQLMSHSAGFRAATWPWGGDKAWEPFEPTRWEQVVAMFPYTEIMFPPGSRYSYSNPGVIFLGRIIELLSGDDYEIYVTKNIFMPLGMTRSFFDRAPRHLIDFRSHSFRRDDGGIEEQRFDFDTGITVSNGGLNAPPADMVKWLAFLIEGNETILNSSSLDEMFTRQIGARDGEGGSGDDVSAGLSCFM
jgi:CubicO group peptidase (beta-lactamase class C family)